MIHEIGLELQAALRARKCPFTVVDRESTTTATFGRERIVLEHEPNGRDTFGPVRGAHVNPKHAFTRSMAIQVTIYAQSTKAGALEWEHRRRAEKVLDQVLVCLRGIAQQRKNNFVPVGGGFVVPDDLKDSERQGGAVYVLSATFDRAVGERDWDDEIQPEVTVGEDGVSIETGTRRVSVDGQNREEF